VVEEICEVIFDFGIADFGFLLMEGLLFMGGFVNDKP
jgi:hypothetical protein